MTDFDESFFYRLSTAATRAVRAGQTVRVAYPALPESVEQEYPSDRDLDRLDHPDAWYRHSTVMPIWVEPRPGAPGMDGLFGRVVTPRTNQAFPRAAVMCVVVTLRSRRGDAGDVAEGRRAKKLPIRWATPIDDLLE